MICLQPLDDTCPEQTAVRTTKAQPRLVRIRAQPLNNADHSASPIEILRLHMTQRRILDTGKTQNWAGATPLRCHGKRGGRSSPVNRERLCSQVSCPRPVRPGRNKEGEIMSIINRPPEMAKREYELQEP